MTPLNLWMDARTGRRSSGANFRGWSQVWRRDPGGAPGGVKKLLKTTRRLDASTPTDDLYRVFRRRVSGWRRVATSSPLVTGTGLATGRRVVGCNAGLLRCLVRPNPGDAPQLVLQKTFQNHLTHSTPRRRPMVRIESIGDGCQRVTGGRLVSGQRGSCRLAPYWRQVCRVCRAFLRVVSTKQHRFTLIAAVPP